MKVLITNDDGISATGLNALRKELTAVEAIDVSVIAPDSNRSATARSITTHSPLWVEEIEFDDGTTGFSSEGTPVDCVRLADLGLIGERPDLIVSGINHGANLGDDITYSGTVAAALEGIVLGIPAIAVSQQAGRRDGAPTGSGGQGEDSQGEMGWFGRDFGFELAARFTAGLVARLADEPMPTETLLNINCPAGEPTGIEVTRLGKRLYDDELQQVDEDADGRRRYKIYGFEPSFEDEDGTDLSAVARGRISVTPVHFDLTDRGEIERLSSWDLDSVLKSAAG